MGATPSKKIGDDIVVPEHLKGEERTKFITKATLEKKIANEDPDSNIKFTIAGFPINDLLNSDSFITIYPDILDIIFYNPGIVKILKKFETASGFVCQINSMKTVKLADWIVTSVGGKTSSNEMDLLRNFLAKYVETQMFNALLKNTIPDDNGNSLDPQEYFDEVALAAASSIAKNIRDENVKPMLFSSKKNYSVYPISESVTRTDLLTNKGVLVTISGNIGVEKTTGSIMKKGSIAVLLDITLKVVVFNSYIFSKRGLTLTLNGIRERKRFNRAELLDRDIAYQANNATYVQRDGWHSGTEDTSVVQIQKSLKEKLLDVAQGVEKKVADSASSAVTNTATNLTGGLNKQFL